MMEEVSGEEHTDAVAESLTDPKIASELQEAAQTNVTKGEGKATHTFTLFDKIK